jgi:hypothetical protein
MIAIQAVGAELNHSIGRPICQSGPCAKRWAVRNGVALHIDQRIAVISHASQAKTIDQVIVSVPVRAFS